MEYFLRSTVSRNLRVHVNFGLLSFFFMLTKDEFIKQIKQLEKENHKLFTQLMEKNLELSRMLVDLLEKI